MRPENSPTGRSRPSFIEAARRAQIVEAATETVAELGYANASLSQIAKRADISKSVISYHFDGKDELLEQVVTRFFEQTWAHMQPEVDAAETAAGRIRAWVRSQMTFIAAHRSGFLAMVDIIDNHRRPDGTRPFDGIEKDETDQLARILAEGQEAGELRDFDPRTYAVIISQTMDGALVRWAYDGTLDLAGHTPALIGFIDHAIRRKRP